MAIKVFDIDLADVTAIQAGEDTIARVVYRGAQIWPISGSETYEIVASTVALHYTGTDESSIRADCGNYAYFTADVDMTTDGVTTRLHDEVLTPVLSTSNPTSVNQYFEIVGDQIQGKSVGTTRIDGSTLYPYPTAIVDVYYKSADPIQSAGTVRRGENVPERTEISSIDFNMSATGGGNIPASGNATFSVSFTRNLTITWTSGYQVPDTDHGGTVSVKYGDPLAVIQSGLSNDATFSYNLPANETTSATSYTFDVVYDGDNDKHEEFVIRQNPGQITYATPVIHGLSVDKIPVTGGTVTPTWTSVTQSWGWNGNQDTHEEEIQYEEDPTLVVFSPASVYAEPIGFNEKPETAVGTIDCSVTLNNKTASSSLTVYQLESAYLPQADEITHDILTTINGWTSDNPCPAEGYEQSFNYKILRNTLRHWNYNRQQTIITNVSTQVEPVLYGTGLVLGTGSGTTGQGDELWKFQNVKWENRGQDTGAQRSATITVSILNPTRTEAPFYDSRTVTVYQAKNELLDTTYNAEIVLGASTVDYNGRAIKVDALGYTITEYDSGQYGDDTPVVLNSSADAVFLVNGDGFSFETSAKERIVASVNTTYSFRTGVVSLTWNSIHKTATITQTKNPDLVCPVSAIVTVSNRTASGFEYSIVFSTDTTQIDYLESTNVNFYFTNSDTPVSDAIEDFAIPTTISDRSVPTASDITSYWSTAQVTVDATAYLGNPSSDPDAVNKGDIVFDCTLVLQ